ncbi:MAG: SDR family oxidoreductase [Betaproteobacteria bacterium]
MRVLNGKVALITGSIGGIGLAAAHALAARGCSVMLNGLEGPALAEPALAALRDHDVTAHYCQADLDDPRAVDRLVFESAAISGGVDILINNAVIRHFAPVDAFPPEAWDRALAVNISAPFHAVRGVLPGMRQRGWGRIINMTSVYGERGTPNRVDYSTTKAALAGMTRAVAAEVMGQGITCNAVSPSSVLTPNIESRLQAMIVERGIDREAATREFLAGKQPVARFVPAEHVAELIAFLCSDAAAEINGANLPVDHGWLAT